MQSPGDPGPLQPILIPSLGDSPPRKGNSFTKAIGKCVLRILAWRITGSFPNESKLVIIAAPHTSNWDFIVGMSAILALGVSIRWLGKHTIFVWPASMLLRWLGGIPVDRTAHHGVVEQSISQFQNREKMLLGLSPEGTRKRVDHWKTGFYHIAVGAGVPVLLVALDYATKEIKIGPTIQPSGNLQQDLKEIQSFYSDIRGKYSDQFSVK